MRAKEWYDYEILSLLVSLNGKSDYSLSDYIAKSPEKVKKPIGLVHVDLRDVDFVKTKLFALAFIQYLTKTVWTKRNEANEYLNFIGEAIYKYIDVVSNINKEWFIATSDLV